MKSGSRRWRRRSGGRGGGGSWANRGHLLCDRGHSEAAASKLFSIEQ